MPSAGFSPRLNTATRDLTLQKIQLYATKLRDTTLGPDTRTIQAASFCRGSLEERPPQVGRPLCTGMLTYASDLVPMSHPNASGPYGFGIEGGCV